MAKMKHPPPPPPPPLLFVLSLFLLVFPSPALGLHTEQCEAALGMQSGAIPDEHINSSSYFDASVNAIYGRLMTEAGGGAWCPREMVYKEGKEYLEVNLGTLHVVTKVEVQGRFGNGQGMEFARQYKLQVWRPGLAHWVTYVDGRGEELLEGNTNTYLAQTSQLSPPIIATRVRFLPYSDHPRTVCMRVELYGCQYSDGLVSYSMPDGDLRGGDTALSDLTYDGVKRGGWLTGGLGQLTDGETGHTNFRVDALGMGRGYEWVGWKNTSRQGQPVPLTFRFESLRNFSAVHVYVNNFFTKETMMFSRARVTFSVGGEHFPAHTAVEYRHSDRIFEHARNVTIKLHGAVGRYVRLELFFALKWLMVSEVSFDSVPCRCNLTEEEEEAAVAAEAATTEDTVSDERLVEGRAPVVPAEQQSSAFLLGGLIFLALVCGMVPLVLGVAYYHRRAARKSGKKSPPPSESGEARKVSMKMKDLHINVNLSPVSNGYAKAKGRLYGHVAVDEEASAMYQEPFKAPPMHNPAYYTLGHSASSDTPLKCALPDTDDSVDYAVPDVNMTPPPPFSEVYTPPPPPVPLTKPPATLPTARSLREATLTAAPVPALPPPPDQEYYAAPLMCQPTNIQGAAGTVAYAVTDAAVLGPEPPLPEVCRTQLRVMDTLGEGVFGLVQLCEARDATPRKVVLRTLKLGADEETKKTFRQETQTLARLDSPHLVRVVAASHAAEPPCALLEYPEHGDLCQFLQRHKVEEAGGPTTCVGVLDPPALSYGALVYMVTQVASGMQYLEAAGVVHRDLAARNCMVGRGLTVKVSDLAMSRALYSADYYRLNEGRTLLPVRWMAWESVLQGRFSTKSDVWAFGVTLWEILTMARQQPFAELSDEGVLENASHCLHGDGAGRIVLPQPPLCPREIYDMMAACWRLADRQRPPFWEIVMFLQRKNLGYTFDYTN